MTERQAGAAKGGAKKKEKTVNVHVQPDDMTLEEWQAEIRKATAATKAEDFTIQNTGGEHPVYADYAVTNAASGRTYKVALRPGAGATYCACLDFKTSGLGTCKHIEAVWLALRKDKRHAALLRQPYQPAYSSLYIAYGEDRQVKLRLGTEQHEELAQLARQYFDDDLALLPHAYSEFETFLGKAAALSPDFRCYNDVVEHIITLRDAAARARTLAGLPASTYSELTTAQLYPYQLEGVQFAYRAGRCLIADEMGLGKTLQAIAASELFRRESGVANILIVCPTSLKYQWKHEIQKFTGQSATVVEGGYAKRRPAYASSETAYKIVSYHAAMSDVEPINAAGFDLVILDEAQRIKNWDTKTARAIKRLDIRYAIVLTGTPLENKLEELYSIIQFLDPFKLGALYRFLDTHQLKDEAGKVIGYGKLSGISQTLSNCVIRRTKAQVMNQLPGRTDQTIFVGMTAEQMDRHNEHADTVARLASKWKQRRYLDEKDRLRLLTALGCMRMVADSTFVLDQTTRFDTKVTELASIIETCLATPGTKMVIFSQWERMLRLVRDEAEVRGIGYSYFHGGVPGEKRGALIDAFRDDPDCRIFFSTDAGGVGLNLQHASVVVNIDLPWNPAVLEQRIGRVYRHGQKQPVSVINLVSKDSIEERMLDVLAFKSSLFSGVLDGAASEVFMGESKFNKLMRTVEDLSAKPAAPVAATEDAQQEFSSAEEASNETSPTEADMANPIPSEKTKTTPSPDLFATAGQLFASLAETFADKEKTARLAASFIETDARTGQRTLKIPLESQPAATKILTGLTELFTSINK